MCRIQIVILLLKKCSFLLVRRIRNDLYRIQLRVFRFPDPDPILPFYLSIFGNYILKTSKRRIERIYQLSATAQH